jgi:hypothetical protein
MGKRGEGWFRAADGPVRHHPANVPRIPDVMLPVWLRAGGALCLLPEAWPVRGACDGARAEPDGCAEAH